MTKIQKNIKKDLDNLNNNKKIGISWISFRKRESIGWININGA